MPPDLKSSVRQVEYGALSARQQLKRMIGKLVNPHVTVQALFYGDDGQLRPEAVEWLGQLAADNFVDRSGFDPDPRIHAKNEGRREVVLEILGSLRLDTAKLAHLTRQLREIENG